MQDRRPLLIVQATDIADVIATVNFAREQGLDLAIRGGGHSVPGFGTCDDGLVLELGVNKGCSRRTRETDGPRGRGVYLG
jgi:FAD/FMN-containing dehydrogenase